MKSWKKFPFFSFFFCWILVRAQSSSLSEKTLLVYGLKQNNLVEENANEREMMRNKKDIERDDPIFSFKIKLKTKTGTRNLDCRL